MAPGCEVSIDALKDIEPSALDLAGLKASLRACRAARSELDALELRLIAEFDERAGCVSDGMVNTRAWLGHHTGVARQIAGSRVRLARKLRELSHMAEALGAGEVTEGHARLLASCLKPKLRSQLQRDEEMLVTLAKELEADDFALVTARWLYLNDLDGSDPGEARPSELHVSSMMSGRTRLDGELDLDDSVDFLAELDALYDEQWHQDQTADDGDPRRTRTASERYAAALAEMARRSSAAGDRDDDPPDEAEARQTRRPRMPKFVVRVDLPALEGDPRGVAELEDGTPVPIATVAEWVCESSVARVVFAGESRPIDLGTETYLPSPAQRRALLVRDKGCIVPGCRRKARWCHAHHVIPFPNGPTNLRNLVLLCKRHHKDVHRRRIVIERDGTGRHYVTRPDGSRLFERPPPALVA